MSPAKHISIIVVGAAIAYGVTFGTTNGMRDEGDDSTFGMRLKIPVQVGRYFARPDQKVNPLAFNIALVGQCLVDGVFLDLAVIGLLVYRSRSSFGKA
jgi:hypothetical protein